MPKILKLSAYYYPEQVASSHLNRDLDAALHSAGYSIENYVPTPTRGVSDEVRDEYKGIRSEVLDDGMTIVHRFPMFREGRNPLQRALRYFLVNLIQYWKGCHADDVDVIYAASTPPTQGMLCGLVKRRLSKRYGRDVPFVFNLQDIFPDSLVNAKMTHEGSFLWKIGRLVENFAYDNADKIITISGDFKRNIMDKGVPEEKIVVIPNWVNTTNVYPVARENNVLFDRLDLDRNLFYVCYSGNIGHSQNMDLLLRVAEKVAQERCDIRFVLIGEGAAKEEVCRQVECRHIENVLVFPFQDYSEIAYVFSLGDVGLIISKPNIGESSVPSKTWSIMAAERPIIASFDSDSELAELISKSNAGVVIDAGDEEALIKSILSLANDKEELARLGQNGRNYLRTYNDKDACIMGYINTINQTLR